MEGRTLPTDGLQGPTVSEGVVLERHVRYRLPAGASVIDPLKVAIQNDERSCLRTTEISKMKGQGLVCAQNAKLIAVNLRYIAYAMKEGFVRVINQNGKDLFKLHNTTRAVITDMAINGTGNSVENQGTTLLCVDEAAHVSIFVLEAYGAPSNSEDRTKKSNSEERTKKVDLIFPRSMDPPQRILGHPADNQSFVTMHANHLGVWNLLAMEQDDPKDWNQATGFFTYEIDEELMANTSQQFVLPNVSSGSTSPRLRDAAVSADATCLVALAADAVFVWRLGAASERGTPTLLQHLSLAPTIASVSGLHSVRILGASPDEAEVLVIGSATASDLFAYELLPSSPTPVGPLLQSLSLVSSSGDDLIGCIDANSVSRDSLAIAFRNKTLVLVLPLALGWSGSPGLPFPYAQRFITEEPAHQLSTMTGKSFQTAGQTLFMYRANNFTREKDSLLGCNIVVSELENPALLAREAPQPSAAAPSSAAAAAAAGAPAAAAAPSAAPPGAQAVPAGTGAAPLANGFAEAAEAAAEERGSEAAGREPSPTGGSKTQSSGEEAAPRPASGFEIEATEQSTASANASDRKLQTAHPPPSMVADPATNGASAAEGLGDEEGEASVTVDGAAAANLSGNGSQAVEGSSRRHRQSDRQPDRPDLDWGFVKHVAASFVHGLERRKGEMADRILKEVSEAVQGTAGTTGDADTAALEQALARVREARDAQSTCERNLQSAARKATDMWADASSVAIASVLQKELAKISDGVAATLAQQLSQSKKFCEALARGVQKSGGAVTKQALEALRPPKQLQETVGSALTEALHESLAPVFKAELRLHFEQELAPLIGQRVGEMMASFRDRMGKCLEGIASEHEQAGQRLGRDLAPIVAEELRHVESIIAQHRPPASAGDGLTESQLDELAHAVQAEVVQPLHARIQDLTMQVQALREESRRLEERWQAAQRAQRAAPAGAGCAEEDEEAQACELENLFREGKVSEAFINGMHLQVESAHCDFLGRVCALVPDGGVEDWLAEDGGGGLLQMQVKMLLMLSLARQLEGGTFPEQTRAKKIEWITELWFAFDPAEPTVAANAATLCAQLTEALDRIQPGECGSEAAAQLRRLKKGVQQSAKLLQNK